jgi:hypothetical protein
MLRKENLGVINQPVQRKLGRHSRRGGGGGGGGPKLGGRGAEGVWGWGGGSMLM